MIKTPHRKNARRKLKVKHFRFLWGSRFGGVRNGIPCEERNFYKGYSVCTPRYSYYSFSGAWESGIYPRIKPVMTRLCVCEVEDLQGDTDFVF